MIRTKIKPGNSKVKNEIALINIFASINGEGYAAGKPTVFIRTMGCNLKCVFCFAKDQGGNYPFVLDESGRTKRLNDVKTGDKILTQNPETKEIYATAVTNVMSREAEPDTIRKVILGKVGTTSFNVTGEHPFYTNTWKAVKDINEGEYVRRTTNKNIYKYLVENKYISSLSAYAKKAAEYYINKHQTNINFGDKNGNYKLETIERNFMHVKKGLIEMPLDDYPLKDIWGVDNLVVHHVDNNHANDTFENLVIIPKRIHDKLHGRGDNFGKANLDDYIEVIYNKPRRKNRKYGNTVINIETEAHSYYVKNTETGDAILVHNCDTKECWTKENFHKVYPERDDYMWMTAQEIFDRVEEMEKGWKHKSICLTGGEPLVEENKKFMMDELLPLFLIGGYDVGIETDGGVDYSDYKERFGNPIVDPATGNRWGVTIIADYKLPHSKMNKLMIKSNFPLYSEYDLVKMVISDDEEDWKELDWVVNESKTKAQIYLSPCFGEVTMHKIPDYIMAHADKNIKAQLQIHKFFWEPTKKDC